MFKTSRFDFISMILLIAVVWIATLGSAYAAATVTVDPLVTGTYTLRRVSNNRIVSSGHATLEVCVAAAPKTVTREYRCEFAGSYAVHVLVTTTTPTCPSKPADETRAQTCPAGTTGSWSQTRGYVSEAYPTCWTAGPWTPGFPPDGFCVTDPTTPPPVDPPPSGDVLYTNLSSAPSCASVVQYPSKNVVSAAASGLPIHEGRCLEATMANVKDQFTATRAGDVLCLHAGTYTGVYGEGTWYNNSNFETYKKGTAAQPIAIVPCIGADNKPESVTLKPSGRPSLIFGNGDAGDNGTRPRLWAEYLTFAGFKIIASAACASGGGTTTDPSGGASETGGRYIRLVDIDCEITDATSNTMTGLIDVQGDGWKLLGIKLRDPANRVIINNNHGLYIQGGADDFEIGWPDIKIHGGAQIQIHQDGTPKLMERGWIHDGQITATNYGDGRGISVINIDNASTIKIERTKIFHQGQSAWGCVQVYRGIVTIEGLNCFDTQGTPLNVNGGYDGTRKVTVNNSKLCSTTTSNRIGSENGAATSSITETNPVSCQ